MIRKASLLRLAGLLVAFVLAVGVGATGAQAVNSKIYPLSGNARFQIGDGLPLPISFGPPPNGKVTVVSPAYIRQTTGAAPKKITLLPHQLTWPGPKQTLGVFALNTAVFQVATSLVFEFPQAKATFKKGGRTGGAVVSVCAGSFNAGANPSCGSGTASTAAPVPGRMVYTKTAAQFGGPMQGDVGGGADVALKFATPPACLNCTVLMALANPAGTGAQGAAFGFKNGTAGAAPVPGRRKVNANGAGKVTADLGTTGSGKAGVPNPATSWGGPWTTGKITVSQPKALGKAELFVLSGKDGRSAGGIGTISLVSSSISNRGISGPNANRGWMKLVAGGAVPSMSGPGLAAFVGLLALSGGYLLRRRFVARSSK